MAFAIRNPIFSVYSFDLDDFMRSYEFNQGTNEANENNWYKTYYDGPDNTRTEIQFYASRVDVQQFLIQNQVVTQWSFSETITGSNTSTLSNFQTYLNSLFTRIDFVDPNNTDMTPA